MLSQTEVGRAEVVAKQLSTLPGVTTSESPARYLSDRRRSAPLELPE